MARIDPWAGERTSPVIETKEFKDIRHPGKTLDMTLMGMENDVASVVTDEVDEICARYLPPGNPEGERLREIYGIEYVEFPYVGGRPVRLSRTLLQNAATIVAMQQPRQDKLPVYEIPELVAMSLTWPNAWKEIVGWANDLNRQAREQEGNASGATGETA